MQGFQHTEEGRHALVHHSRRVSPTMSMCGLLSTDGCPVSFSRAALLLEVGCFPPGGGSSRGILLPRSGLERSLDACCGTTSPTKRARGRDMAAPASKTADDSYLPNLVPKTLQLQQLPASNHIKETPFPSRIQKSERFSSCSAAVCSNGRGSAVMHKSAD